MSPIVALGGSSYEINNGGAVIRKPYELLKKPFESLKYKPYESKKISKIDKQYEITPLIVSKTITKKTLYNYKDIREYINIIRGNSYTVTTLVKSLEKIKYAIINNEINELTIYYLMNLYNRVVINYKSFKIEELNNTNFIIKIDEILSILFFVWLGV